MANAIFMRAGTVLGILTLLSQSHPLPLTLTISPNHAGTRSTAPAVEADIVGKSWFRSLGTAAAFDINYVSLSEATLFFTFAVTSLTLTLSCCGSWPKPSIRRTTQEDYAAYRDLVARTNSQTPFYDSEFCPHDYVVEVGKFKALLDRIASTIPACK